ncbi:MAG: DNA cytosine methyltransferase [Aminipila sp.]
MKAQTNFLDEMIIDNFAGGGGASTGIELAIGRPVDVAINHDPASIQMHSKNHPYTRHYCEDVYDVDPLEVTQGRPVALCWFSPDCKHFSKAKGGKPRDKKIRGLAWVAVRWAALAHPRVIILENVEEFKTWGPLTKDGQPDINQKGRTFNSFVNALKRQGYEVQWQELKACDYGAPTIRKRFFLIARCDGKPIVFPKPTHGEGTGLKPYRTAAEIIDWTIPTKSIFGRKKPLADNTLRRIARGIDKFVINNPQPFITSIGHTSQKDRTAGINEPLRTIVSKAEHCVTIPYMVPIGYGERIGQHPRVNSIEEPISTVVSSCKQYLAAPYLIQYHSEITKNEVRGQELTQPMYTLDTNPRYAFTEAFLTEYYGNGNPLSPNEPLHTITTKDRNAIVSVRTESVATNTNSHNWSEVRELLNKYCDYNIKDNEILVLTVNGIDCFIADIGLRMLEPRELYNAQGFPADYIIDFEVDSKKYTKKEQIARCGNSVSPVIPEALIRVNLPELCGRKYSTMAELESALAI